MPQKINRMLTIGAIARLSRAAANTCHTVPPPQSWIGASTSVRRTNAKARISDQIRRASSLCACAGGGTVTVNTPGDRHVSVVKTQLLLLPSIAWAWRVQRCPPPPSQMNTSMPTRSRVRCRRAQRAEAESSTKLHVCTCGSPAAALASIPSLSRWPSSLGQVWAWRVHRSHAAAV